MADSTDSTDSGQTKGEREHRERPLVLVQPRKGPPRLTLLGVKCTLYTQFCSLFMYSHSTTQLLFSTAACKEMGVPPGLPIDRRASSVFWADGLQGGRRTRCDNMGTSVGGHASLPSLRKDFSAQPISLFLSLPNSRCMR